MATLMSNVAGCIGAILGGAVFQASGAMAMWTLVFFIILASVGCNALRDITAFVSAFLVRREYEHLEPITTPTESA